MSLQSRFVLLTRGMMESCLARLLGLQVMRYNLWCSGCQEEYGRVGVVVNDALCDRVLEVWRTNDRVLSLAIVFEEVVRMECAYVPQG